MIDVVDFLYLIRELIISTRQESLVIDSVCDGLSFPWMAVAGMSYWQFDMPCFSHLRQAGLLSSLTQLGRSDRGCSDSICLEAFTNTFIQSCRQCPSQLSLNTVYIITYLNCAGVNVYKGRFTQWINSDYCRKPWREWLRQLSNEETG